MMRSRVAILCLALLATACRASAPSAPAARNPQLWANDIAAFEKADAAATPPEGAVLFMGSSSVRMWDLKKYFPGLSAINRGFGGSYISDSTHYADRIAVPYKPRLIVLYAGDNEITDGRDPELVASDFGDFLARVRVKERVPVIFISIKPSPLRLALWPRMRQANKLIKLNCGRQPECRFLDVSSAMLDRDEKPRPELFQPDGLHLSYEGYRLWTSLLNPFLDKP
jgi:lysophospholipase L1-like esterase